jgi:hypothetical protein
MRHRAGVCHNCGEPVSQFAAGCAICGADLSAQRARTPTGPSLAGHVRPPNWLATERGKTAALLTVLVLMVLVSPLLCLILGAMAVVDRNRRGDFLVRNVIVALMVVDVGLLFIPALRFGLYSLLY